MPDTTADLVATASRLGAIADRAARAASDAENVWARLGQVDLDGVAEAVREVAKVLAVLSTELAGAALNASLVAGRASAAAVCGARAATLGNHVHVCVVPPVGHGDVHRCSCAAVWRI